VGDRGYGSVLALSLLMGGVLLVGLASDVARLAAAWQDASHHAHAAAEIGAGWVRPAALYNGDLRIDRRAARQAAVSYLRSQGAVGSVDTYSSRVCVTVLSSIRPTLTRFVGAGDQDIRVRACAEPRQG
jgi:hypothetical protein